MAIFVSEPIKVAGHRWRCLFSDAGDAELHAFAVKIGAARDRHYGPNVKTRSRKRDWSHYRLSEALAGAAFRAGAAKADRIKLVECSSGKRAAARLAKKLAAEAA